MVKKVEMAKPKAIKEQSELEELKAKLAAATEENEALRGRANTRASIANGSEEKKRRRPFMGKAKGKLDFSDLKEIDPIRFGNKNFRVANHEGTNIAEMIQNGWEIVELEGSQRVGTRYDFHRGVDTSQQTSQIERHVGVTRHGDDTKAVLMMKSSDWYKEDETAYHHSKMADINRSFEQGLDQSEGLDGERAGQVNTYAPYVSGNRRGMSIQQAYNEGK